MDDVFMAKGVVDPVIRSSCGIFSIRLNLPNPDHKISVGLHCKVGFKKT